MGRKGYGAVARGTQGTSSHAANTQTGHGPSSLKYKDLDRRYKKRALRCATGMVFARASLK